MSSPPDSAPSGKLPAVAVALAVVAVTNPIPITAVYLFCRWRLTGRARSAVASLKGLEETLCRFSRTKEIKQDSLKHDIGVLRAQRDMCLSEWETLQHEFETTWFPYLRFQRVRNNYALARAHTRELHNEVNTVRTDEIQLLRSYVAKVKARAEGDTLTKAKGDTLPKAEGDTLPKAKGDTLPKIGDNIV